MKCFRFGFFNYFFFLQSQAYFEGEFFACNSLNRCVYMQHIYFSHSSDCARSIANDFLKLDKRNRYMYV